MCGAAVGALIGRLAVAPLVTAAARRLAPGGSTGVSVEEHLAGAVNRLLSSRETIYAVRDLVTGLVGAFAARPMAEVWQKAALRDVLSRRLLPALAEEQRRTAIATFAGVLVAGRAGQALSDGVISEVTAVVQSAVPQATDALLDWLESAETREELSARGRELLPRILEKLSDLQKLFLTAGQFDRRLNEQMPEIVDETVRVLRRMILDPRQQQRLLDVFSTAARGWRDSLLVTGPAEAGGPAAPREKLARAAEALVDRFLATLEDPAQGQRVASEAADRAEADTRTAGAFARETLGVQESQVVDLISANVLRLLTDRSTAQTLARAGAAQLGELLPRLTRDVATRAGGNRLLSTLGAVSGLCAGLLVIGLRALGLG